MVMLPKSGWPVTGQTDVNSSLMCSIRKGWLVGDGNTSSNEASGMVEMVMPIGLVFVACA